MWQALLDDKNTVITVNNWEHKVGVPCDANTPIGWVWTGTEFVEPLESIIDRYDQALLDYFDSVAAQRRYDNRITCALRAGFPGPFQAEGIAFGVWMDTCNKIAYQLMNKVIAGEVQLPTIEEVIASLPVIEWPK